MAENVPEKYRLRALLHDAAEAYLGDIPSPVKMHLPDFIKLEKIVHKAICKRFGIKIKIPRLVKEADRLLLGCERREGMKFIEDGWGNIGLGSKDITPQFWTPEQAKREFLIAFESYTKNSITSISSIEPTNFTVAGIDGTNNGWVVALWNGPGSAAELTNLSDIQALDRLRQQTQTIAMDVPIGLLDKAQTGGRACERETRKLIKRKSSVFSSPVRGALEAEGYAQACTINRQSSDDAIGLSQQTFHIIPKIREVDAYLRTSTQEGIFEVHPELCFHMMSQGKVTVSKKKTEGRKERENALTAAGFIEVTVLVKSARAHGAKADDVLDALAAAWSAWRIATGEAERYPATPAYDSTGLEMAIWG
ncbi:MAG: DUF429 domain-containing protein [Gammaproteobacteria bacterium]|nr:DUF429 domain-containing protein [Gammaproteobacteria bacterium]